MKKIFTICASVILLASNFASANQLQAPKEEVQKQKSKDVDNIRTFDFERILKETQKYFEAASSWKKIKCTPKSVFVCTKRECPKIKGDNTYTVIDKKNKAISICRSGNCKLFRAEINHVGVFHNVKVKDSDGVIIRILGDNRYKEITMLGLDAYISNGECEEYDKEKELKMAKEKMKTKDVTGKKVYRLKKGK